MTTTVTLLGYYGFRNLGDDLLLATLMQCLADQPVRCQILTQSPAETAALYPQAACIHRMRPGQVMQALRRSDWLVLGGGGLFQDSSSIRNVVYYAGMVRLARLLGNKILWWAQGIGPLASPASQWLTAWALQASDRIAVRDAASVNWVNQLTHGKKNALLVSDPVWLLKPSASTTSDESIGVSLREWSDLTEAGIVALANAIDRCFPLSQSIILLPFQAEQDEAPLRLLQQTLNPARSIQWASEGLAVFPRLSGLVGMRFHALILAILHNVPAFAIDYDPKVSQLAHQLGIPSIKSAELSKLTDVSLSLANPTVLTGLQAEADLNRQILQNLSC